MNIQVQGLQFVYNPGTPLEVTALRGIDFELPAGKVLGILGGTGSGKTTLIKTLNGLLEPSSGRVLLDGIESTAFGSGLALKVGVVFQRPERQLFEPTVREDVSFVLRRFSDLDDAAIQRRVFEASNMVGLDIEAVGDRSPTSLPDGTKRQAAIAGILVNQPDVLILDEPAVGLDPKAIADLIRLVGKLKESGRTVIVVAHDMDAFLASLDLLMVLHAGTQAAFGTPSQVCSFLADNDAVRGMLPGLAMLIHDLRNNGCAMPENEFRIPVMIDRLITLRGQCGSS